MFQKIKKEIIRKICFSFFCAAIISSCISGREILSEDIQDQLVKTKIVESGLGKEEFKVTDLKIKSKKSKRYFWYRAGRVHNSVGGYDGMLLNNEYKRFYENHDLRERGTFKNGVKKGVWYLWHPNGNVSEKIKYNNDGLPHGYYAMLDDSGDLIIEGNYNKGKRHRKWIDYQENDTIRYRHGKLLIEDNLNRPNFFQRLFKKKNDSLRKLDSLRINERRLKSENSSKINSSKKEKNSFKKEGFFKRLFNKNINKKDINKNSKAQEKGKESAKTLKKKEVKDQKNQNFFSRLLRNLFKSKTKKVNDQS